MDRFTDIHFEIAGTSHLITDISKYLEISEMIRYISNYFDISEIEILISTTESVISLHHLEISLILDLISIIQLLISLLKQPWFNTKLHLEILLNMVSDIIKLT